MKLLLSFQHPLPQYFFFVSFWNKKKFFFRTFFNYSSLSPTWSNDGLHWISLSERKKETRHPFVCLWDWWSCWFFARLIPWRDEEVKESGMPQRARETRRRKGVKACQEVLWFFFWLVLLFNPLCWTLSIAFSLRVFCSCRTSGRLLLSAPQKICVMSLAHLEQNGKTFTHLHLSGLFLWLVISTSFRVLWGLSVLALN